MSSPSTEGLIERLEDQLENAMIKPISDYVPVEVEDMRAILETLARTPPIPEGPPDDVLVEVLKAADKRLCALVGPQSEDEETRIVVLLIREALARFTQPKGGTE